MKTVSTPQARNVLRMLLKDARLAAGLTQRQLAARLKKHQSYVARYESGARRLTVIEFVAVARALRCDPTRLLGTLLKKLTL